MNDHSVILAAEFERQPEHVRQVLAFLDDGQTVPFIARYRKEASGGMDDQTLRRLADRLSQLRAVDSRREDIRRLLGEQGVLNDALTAELEEAKTLAALEDLYRPYRPKRRTRAQIARERGLEPLAEALRGGSASQAEIERLADAAVDPNGEVSDRESALAGARDIIAEGIADDPHLRDRLRRILRRTGRLSARFKRKRASAAIADLRPEAPKTGAAASRDAADRDPAGGGNGNQADETVYDRFDGYDEPIDQAAGHRVLALDRAEKEAVLSVSLSMDDELALQHILQTLPAKDPQVAAELRQAAEDGWKRLLFPSLESEIRGELSEQAQEEAIGIFAANLRQLLMQPPLRGQVVLALDPGYRTGCKLAVLDATGMPLHSGVIYPTPPRNQTAEAAAELVRLCARFAVTCIAIGNGTASRETESFVSAFIRDKQPRLRRMVVNEAGASVYSASPLGAAEFPRLDATQRSAISIGRRLQDPLAELVKIEPQAIGVGQYQHDLPEKRLAQVLDGVVEDSVSDVGADLNTASAELLTRIAGLNRATAGNIVAYRDANGAFTARRQLLHVPRLGPRAYEQCAGFLRVVGGDEPLDNTRVHPESYALARRLRQMPEPRDLPRLAAEWGVGLSTLSDIQAALDNPGYDPRGEIAQAELCDDVREIGDLRPDMVLRGVVRNVAAFGAFVDIGVHQDGLVHISELADRFVTRPQDVVRVGQAVRVRVLSVDVARKRIALSMKGLD